MNKIRDELKLCLSNGENNLTIKYERGLLAIIIKNCCLNNQSSFLC